MKKKYDRKSKKWLDTEEYERKVKKRKQCKGSKPHDFVEILPHGVTYNKDYKHNPQPYHEAMKKISDYEEKIVAELEKKHGIISRRYRAWNNDYRHLVCAVCKKQKWQTE